MTALALLTQHPGASVTLSSALELVASSVFIGIASGDRLDVPNVAVVLTTNNATQVDEDLQTAAQLVRNAGIEVRRHSASADGHVIKTVMSSKKIT